MLFQSAWQSQTVTSIPHFSRNQTALRLLFVLLGLIGLPITLLAADELRTWSDMSGKFSVKAKLIKEEGGSVFLQTEAGKELKIPVSKLSAADQQFLKANPTENPFEAVEPGTASKAATANTASKANAAGATASVGGAPKELKPDWFNIPEIGIATAPADWKLEVTTLTPPAVNAKTRPINTTPANKDFFERLVAFKSSPASQRGVLCYQANAPGAKAESTRLILLDLAANKILGAAVTEGKWNLLAVSPDGQQVAMQGERGVGDKPPIELWTLGMKGIERQASWVPFPDKDDWNKEIKWAAYVDGKKLLTLGSWGKLALWNLDDAKPQWWTKIEGNATPALSVDGKWLAVWTEQGLGTVELAAGKFAAKRSGQRFGGANSFAFSPNGSPLY